MLLFFYYSHYEVHNLKDVVFAFNAPGAFSGLMALSVEPEKFYLYS